MKVMIINGSPRKNGATAYLLHKIEANLSARGTEVIFYNLSEQKMSMCNGCCICYKTGHCIHNDSAEEISKQIREVDGLIIGSSTIASNVPGILKTFIDRGHFVIEQLLSDKYSLCVATYENYGGQTTLKILKSLTTLSGSLLSGAIALKIPFNSDYSLNKTIDKIAQKYSAKLYKDISTKRKYRMQKIKQFFVINIGLKPFILQKGDSYKAIQERWRELGLLAKPAKPANDQASQR
nr:flavodoxin family protein [uncultured Agathobaculum sp.]